MSTNPQTVCALPGCPAVVPSHQLTARRGFCERHASEAIIEAIDSLGGHLDRLTSEIDRLAEQLQARAA
jgi:hypothetical protein